MTTNADITIYNTRLDEDTRRDVLYPTVIKGVSYHESVGASGGFQERTESSEYKIRIPFTADTSGREYVDPETYQGLSDVSGCWTIQTDDIIRIGRFPSDVPVDPDSLTGIDYLIVGNHADNTKRGSAFTRHWRITCGKER